MTRGLVLSMGRWPRNEETEEFHVTEIKADSASSLGISDITDFESWVKPTKCDVIGLVPEDQERILNSKIVRPPGFRTWEQQRFLSWGSESSYDTATSEKNVGQRSMEISAFLSRLRSSPMSQYRGGDIEPENGVEDGIINTHTSKLEGERPIRDRNLTDKVRWFLGLPAPSSDSQLLQNDKDKPDLGSQHSKVREMLARSISDDSFYDDSANQMQLINDIPITMCGGDDRSDNLTLVDSNSGSSLDHGDDTQKDSECETLDTKDMLGVTPFCLILLLFAISAIAIPMVIVFIFNVPQDATPTALPTPSPSFGEAVATAVSLPIEDVTPTALPTPSPSFSLEVATNVSLPIETPSALPTPSPYFREQVAADVLSPATNCTACSDNPYPFMRIAGEECAPDHLMVGTKCNKNLLWSRKKYCQKSCFTAGYGYEGDDCCQPERTPPDTPSTCTICDDEPNPFMRIAGEECSPDHEMIETKCNKNLLWSRKKYCRASCYIAGYGYQGDFCCSLSSESADSLTENLEIAFPTPSPSSMPSV